MRKPPTLTSGRLLDVLDGIYAAAGSPAAWHEALTGLADAFGADDAALGTLAPEGIVWMVSPRTDPHWMARYTPYHAENAVWHAIAVSRAGSAITDDMVVSSAQRARSGYYNEWAHPQGYQHKLGSLIRQEGGRQTVLTLPGRRTFGSDAVQALERLTPHIARAVWLNECLQAEHARPALVPPIATPPPEHPERRGADRRGSPAAELTWALRCRFGLTPAEARLALEIARGDGKQAAADRLGISYATARSHLSRIFDKTGVRRQAELVRLVLGVES